MSGWITFQSAKLARVDQFSVGVDTKFCRVVVYPAVRGWSGERIQLEVADELSALGHTDCLRGAGHWLVVDMAPERVVEEVERLRGSQVSVLGGE